MITRILIPLLTILILSSCGGEKAPKKAPVATPTSQDIQLLPTMTEVLRKELAEKCDATDYVFDNLPYSMSLDERNSILQNLQLIDAGPCTKDFRNAPRLGRQHFVMNGELRWIADIYFGPECTCYVFNENEKPTFAHAMSPAGINFYQKMINGVKTSKKQ